LNRRWWSGWVVGWWSSSEISYSTTRPLHHSITSPERLRLQLPQLHQVPDAFLHRLHVPIQHRGVGEDAECVGGAVDVEPLVGADLALEDLVVHAVVEDLRAAAGE
jgi:hypothetical protein